jgi:hypothetical protein
MMATATTAEFIGIAMIADITGDMTTTGAMTATTGVGMEGAGSIGTDTGGSTKALLTNDVSSF